MDVGVPRCWDDDLAFVSAALVDPKRAGQTTSSALMGAAGHKRHETMEFETRYKTSMPSSGRLSVDMMMLKLQELLL
ncbi:jg8816 [Pararge aegeria aegeria]|uniref:Jg8816 protein n=1 Tax=Pararge aegeria aegeria TaxID=348720 RepID=A0A8S4SDZ6_9NEOP|nr:jg8816 [Pararge aegeria aegeria]